jgi:hypothetical protein
MLTMQCLARYCRPTFGRIQYKLEAHTTHIFLGPSLTLTKHKAYPRMPFAIHSGDGFEHICTCTWTSGQQTAATAQVACNCLLYTPMLHAQRLP